MTVFLVVGLVALATGLLVTAGMTTMAGTAERRVGRQLAAIRHADTHVRELREKRRRQARRDRLQTVLQAIGGQADIDDERTSATRRMLQRAGLRDSAAPAIYYAARTLCAATLGVVAFVASGALALDVRETPLIGAFAAAVGWLLPSLYLRLRVKRRQEDIRRALPDALDLLVVCVEAGLGLNQALVRVSDEVDRLSAAMSDELTVVNLELRAGAPRADALRNLSKRTGVTDVQSLVGMLIQTDRFGTSVARGLRVHSNSLRTKRRQRAEEAAAKTSIKMLFPLAFFIFPALLVIILGPAIFHLGQMFGAP
jgi:tight adherence protein C